MSREKRSEIYLCGSLFGGTVEGVDDSEEGRLFLCMCIHQNKKRLSGGPFPLDLPLRNVSQSLRLREGTVAESFLLHPHRKAFRTSEDIPRFVGHSYSWGLRGFLCREIPANHSGDFGSWGERPIDLVADKVQCHDWMWNSCGLM